MASTVMAVIEEIEGNLNGKLGPKFQGLMDTNGGLFVVFGKNNKKFLGVFNGMSFVEAGSKGYDVMQRENYAIRLYDIEKNFERFNEKNYAGIVEFSTKGNNLEEVRIELLFVKEDYARGQIASNALKIVELIAHNHKTKKLDGLFVPIGHMFGDYEGLKDFYNKNGFDITEDEKGYYENLEKFVSEKTFTPHKPLIINYPVGRGYTVVLNKNKLYENTNQQEMGM